MLPSALKSDLEKRLAYASRIAVIGIGSELRGDDMAGMLIARKLLPLASTGRNPAFGVFLGSTAPESITGEIRQFNPTHIIIIDAADIGKSPGEVEFIDPESIDGASFSTHMMPLSIVVRYIVNATGCEVVILGIQPESLEFSETPTPAIQRAIDEITGIFKGVLHNT